MASRIKVNDLVIKALLVAVAVVVSYFERFLPSASFFPGAKLGLANVITIVAMLKYSRREAFSMLIIRIVLTSLIGGGLYSMLYSLAGGVFSFVVMAALITVNDKYVTLVGVSIAGGLFHNLGQLFVASIFMKTTLIFSYLPFLSIAGIFTGVIVGLVSFKTYDLLPN